MKHIIISLIVLLTTTINIFAIDYNKADDDSTYKATISKQYIKSYLLDSRDIIIAPAKWKTREWVTASSLIGVTALAMTQDAKVQKFAQENRTDLSYKITDNFLEPWGSGVYSMGAMGAFYLQGLIFKNERSKKTAMLGVKAYLVTGAIVTIPKILFNRHRPYHDEPSNPNIWEGPFAGKFYRSFVSGHTTSIFAVSTIVASEYKEKKFVPYLVYSIATLSALSRIHDNKHWLSDVVGGAAFGYAMGKLIHNANNWKINVSPYKSAEHTGMVLSYKF